MTYISRKSRIFVSRYLDGRESENALRLCRKRSEGRLKRFSSCDDLRAWVFNNRIKYEHFLDLMSDGEIKKNICGRLYGRFIPVPFLIKLFQQQIGDSKNNELLLRNETYDDEEFKNQNQNQNQNPNQNQEELQKFTTLLNRALSQLENIDRIVFFANADYEKAREEEIQDLLKNSEDFPGSTRSKTSMDYVARRYHGSPTGSAVLRKISGLHDDLKKIQALSDHLENRRKTTCDPSTCPKFQVTEIYNRRQTNVKKPRKNYEKLQAKKGKILTEICDDLRNLNSIKKASRTSMVFRKKNVDDRKAINDIEGFCNCLSDSFNFTGSENTYDSKYGCTASSSTDISTLLDESLKKSKVPSSNDFMFDSSELFKHVDEFPTERKVSPFKIDDRDESLSRIPSFPTKNKTHFNNGMKNTKKSSKNEGDFTPQNSRVHPIKCPDYTKRNLVPKEKNEKLDTEILPNFSGEKKIENTRKLEKPVRNIRGREHSKGGVSKGIPKKRSFLDGNQNSHSPKKDVKPESRPQTAPKPRKDGREDSIEFRMPGKLVKSETSVNDAAELVPQFSPKKDIITERRTKSETTMKEIEKALRNYEQRLQCLETLDKKVEEIKEKLLESLKCKKQMASERAKSKKLQAVERQKCNKKMMGLRAENMELKKKLEELQCKCENQNEKMKNLKCNANRAAELEYETKMLKKEISEYQENLDYQRKCISDWENIVAVQRTEIENLENQIKNLTICMEQKSGKNNPQRSRSYSPDASKVRTNYVPRNQQRRIKMSNEDDVVCCYDAYTLNELNMAMNQEGVCDGRCCPQAQNMQWYYN